MLLTETEVAEKLRCSTSKIKRLRMSGELPYVRGRPVLVDEADLLAFIEARKRRACIAAGRRCEGKRHFLRGSACMGAQEGLRHAAAEEAQAQMKLLTETEAAAVLKCSTTTVKRLRLSGRLTYMEGRPVLIDEADLQAFIDAKAAKKAKKSQAVGQAQRVTVEEARKWARITILLKPAPRRRKT